VSMLMRPITAQTDDAVNAYCGNPRPDNRRMPHRSARNPSPFWRRLDEALGEKWAPLNANSLATRLDKSQGTVYRWFEGTGLPEFQVIKDLAKQGGVCIDWLVSGVKPKYPISKDPVLRELLEVCEDLDEAGRAIVLRAARGELLQQKGEGTEERQKRIGSGSSGSRSS
jgi:hypothetical protein